MPGTSREFPWSEPCCPVAQITVGIPPLRRSVPQRERNKPESSVKARVSRARSVDRWATRGTRASDSHAARCAGAASNGRDTAGLASMRSACDHRGMASMIQIRNVPDELHRDLKVRAARSGMTLSDFLLAELRSLSVRPTMREWLDRTATWEPVEVSESPAEALAAERSRHAA